MAIKWKYNRQSASGKYILAASFAEFNYSKTVEPTFTTAEEDHDGLISMERLFLEYYTDPTEYRFVQEVFDGDVRHWELMKESQYIRDLYPNWKAKALKKLQSEAMQVLVSSALNKDNKQNLPALKYLLELTDEKKGRGRPKKSKNELEVSNKDLLADIARLK